MTQNQFPLKILGTKLTSEKNSPKQWLYSSDLAECRKWLQHLRLVYQSRMVFMVFFVCFCFTSTFVHIQTQKIQLKEAQALNTLNDIKIHYLSTYHQVINIHMYIYIWNIDKYSPDTMKHINDTLLLSNNTTNQKTQLLLWIFI